MSLALAMIFKGYVARFRLARSDSALSSLFITDHTSASKAKTND